MTTRYEVVEAKTSEEALAKSRWKPGMLARCIRVETLANSNGTYSVFPIYEPILGFLDQALPTKTPTTCTSKRGVPNA